MADLYLIRLMPHTAPQAATNRVSILYLSLMLLYLDMLKQQQAPTSLDRSSSTCLHCVARRNPGRLFTCLPLPPSCTKAHAAAVQLLLTTLLHTAAVLLMPIGLLPCCCYPLQPGSSR